MNSSARIALFLLASTGALAQAPEVRSIFDSGLAGSLLVADTVPISIDEARGIEGWGESTSFSSGSWLQIKGTGLASSTKTWDTDFTNDGKNAPTSLDGVSVTIGGKPAFISYVSPTQINVQAPDDAAVGPLPVVITNANGSATRQATKVAVSPGLLAPPSTFAPYSFFVNGKQYVEATFGAQYKFVGNPNLIENFYPFEPAKPGDSIWLYGIGFGDVDPALPAGTVAGADKLIAPLTIRFDQTPADVTYAGHYPGYVGLYLIILTVPDVPDGDRQIIVNLDGQQVPQTLYLTVKRP